jgi:hypothetical protein
LASFIEPDAETAAYPGLATLFQEAEDSDSFGDELGEEDGEDQELDGEREGEEDTCKSDDDGIAANLPEDEQLLSEIQRDFGYCKRFTIDDDLPVLLPLSELYLHRGEELCDLNLWEYLSVIQVAPKADAPEEGGTSNGRTPPRGRKKALRFDFDQGSILHVKYCQKIRSKHFLPFVGGRAPPKRPPSQPTKIADESAASYNKRYLPWKKKLMHLPSTC